MKSWVFDKPGKMMVLGLTASVLSTFTAASMAADNKNSWQKAGEELKEAAAAVGDASKESWNDVEHGSEVMWDKTRKESGEAWGNIKDVSEETWNRIKGSTSAGYTSIKKKIHDATAE